MVGEVALYRVCERKIRDTIRDVVKAASPLSEQKDTVANARV